MNDLEISKALALAIGWSMTNVLPSDENPTLMQCWVWVGYKWRVFDYRDWNVIAPIAERYNCFPYRNGGAWWKTVNYMSWADTPQKAIALAVIGAKK